MYKQSQNITEQVLFDLYNAKDICQAIQQILMNLCQFYGFDKAYIFEINYDRKIMQNTFEWCAQGIKSQKELLQTLPVFLSDNNFASFSCNDEYFYCKNIKELKQKEKNKFLMEDIVSTFQAPLLDNKQIYGIIGFDNYSKSVILDDISLQSLNMVCRILNKEIIRLRKKQNLIREDGYFDFLNATDHYMTVVNPKTFEIIQANEKAHEAFPKLNFGCKCYKIIANRKKPCPTCPFLQNQENKELSGSYITIDNNIFWCQPLITKYNTDEQSFICYVNLKIESIQRTELNKKIDYLNSLIQNTPAGIFSYNLDDDNFVFVSKNMYKLLGYTEKEFTKKFKNCFSKMIFKDDRERVIHSIKKQLKIADFDKCDYRIETKDGSIRWVHDVGHLVTDKKGNRICHVVIVDITEQKQVEENLRIRNEENNIVIKQSNRSSLRYDIKEDTAYYYEASNSTLKIPREIHNFSTEVFKMNIIKEESVELVQNFFSLLHEKKSSAGTFSAHFMINQKKDAYVKIDYTVINDEKGNPEYCIISFFDNTEHFEREKAYGRTLSDLEVFIETCEAYFEANLSIDSVERFLSKKSDRFFSQTDKVPFTKMIEIFAENVHPDDKESFLNFCDKGRLFSLFLKGKIEDSLEFRECINEGAFFWETVSVRIIKSPFANDVLAFFIFSNTDKSHREKERLESLAQQDSMTHLLNHDTTELRIKTLLAKATQKSCSALFMIDIDNFKKINDSFGHKFGDEVIKFVAENTKKMFRSNDIVGRFGGDEFIVFITNNVSVEFVRDKAEKLAEILCFEHEGASISASIGVSLCSGNTKSFEQLYEEADQALYSSKENGKGRSSFHKID